MGFGKAIRSKTKCAGYSRRETRSIECESGNAEVQWKNIKECGLDTISDLVGKVEKRERKAWITQERSVKRMSEGNGRISTLKKEGGITGD